MTQFLPPNLLALFAPRDPIPYLPPSDKLPHEKKNSGYVGVGGFLGLFEDPKDTPPPLRVETRDERMERRHRERAEQVAYKLEQEIAVWDPNGIATATGDPFKTLFVARINYDSSESKLRREFEVYGPIKKIVVTHNTVNGKPRGYAFIEYEHERDMHSRRAGAAYKHADGKKIDGRRVLVDVERARTVKGWLPRRLGGGLGGTRRGGPDVNIKHSGREDNERERERYRLERERENVRGNDRERPERADRGDRPERRRSRSRERERAERDKRRKSRSRSPVKDRKRRRSRDRAKEKDPDIEEVERDERPRDKERERDRREDRKRRRSRSRDRGDRDRKRDRRDRGDRSEKRPERRNRGDPEDEKVRIKLEPEDDYPDYSTSNYAESNYDDTQVKYEREEGEGAEGEEEPAEPNGRTFNSEYDGEEY